MEGHGAPWCHGRLAEPAGKGIRQRPDMRDRSSNGPLSDPRVTLATLPPHAPSRHLLAEDGIRLD